MHKRAINLTTYPHIAAALANCGDDGITGDLPLYYSNPDGAIVNGNAVQLKGGPVVNLANVDAALGILRNTQPQSWEEFTDGDQDEAALLGQQDPALAAATWLLEAYFTYNIEE